MLKTIEVDQNPKLLGHPFTSHGIMKNLPGMLNLCTSQLEIHIPNPIACFTGEATEVQRAEVSC